MRKNLLRLWIVPVLAAAAAKAQTTNLMKAEIPFAFAAGKQMLPAGRYTVQRGPAPGTVAIRSEDHKNAAIVLANDAYSVNGHETPKLVFHRFGSAYFLSEIWTPENNGKRLVPTSRERELAAQAAPPDSTVVAAVRSAK